MDDDIDDNPINKIPNPTAISAFCVIFCLLENVMMKAPIPKINGAKKSGFNAPAHSLADTSHAAVSYTHLDVYKRQDHWYRMGWQDSF